MDRIKQFVNDKELFEGIKNYFIQHLDKVVLDKAYSGKSTEGSDIARQAITQAFQDLKKEYSGEVKREIIEEYK